MRARAAYTESRYVTATLIRTKPLVAASTIRIRGHLPLGVMSPVPRVVMLYPITYRAVNHPGTLDSAEDHGRNTSVNPTHSSAAHISTVKGTSSGPSRASWRRECTEPPPKRQCHHRQVRR
ncbi:hypothetical protein GCM10008955_36400 [Deinococcus malanensis]|uniref:Uncharacterized protein n=1 Tax=Deinococcus malanensis TaxID=1706855 RepID=A0ABQ2F0S3_9DEIO|nr:hypothetical protein GCM10008955_36400 [Deinococcus malanensis]